MGGLGTSQGQGEGQGPGQDKVYLASQKGPKWNTTSVQNNLDSEEWGDRSGCTAGAGDMEMEFWRRSWLPEAYCRRNLRSEKW